MLIYFNGVDNFFESDKLKIQNKKPKNCTVEPVLKAWTDVARSDKPPGKELLSTVLWCNSFLNLKRNQKLNRSMIRNEELTN